MSHLSMVRPRSCCRRKEMQREIGARREKREWREGDEGTLWDEIYSLIWPYFHMKIMKWWMRSYLFAFSYSSWGSQGRNGEWFAITFSTTLEVVQAQLMIRLRIQGSLWLKKGRRHKRWGVVCLAPSNLFHLQLVENPIQTGIGKEYRNFCYQKVKR